MLIKCIDDLALATIVNVKQKRRKNKSHKKPRKEIGKMQATLKSACQGTRQTRSTDLLSEEAFH